MTPRKPVQRAFTGLVGLPPEPDEAVAAQPPTPVAAPEPVVSEPVKAKRGRPAKNGSAMTDAERQRQSRARKYHAETAPERAKLIKLIARRIKTSEHPKIKEMKRILSKFHDVLDQLTLEDLQKIAKTYTLVHDAKGRTALEGHTGTMKIGDEFVARLERIDAKEQLSETIGGRRVSTASPNIDEDSDDTPASRSHMRVSEVTVWDLMPLITETMFEGEEENIWNVEESTLHNIPSLRCAACGRYVSTWVQARHHMEEMVKAGEDLVGRIKILSEAAAGSPGYDGLVVETRRTYADKYWSHHRRAANFVTQFKSKRKVRKSKQTH